MGKQHDRARAAAHDGFSIAENIYCRGLYEIRKPDGTLYTVDAAGTEPTCNCPATVASCKHVALVEISRRYWTALDRKAAAAAAKSARTRRYARRLARVPAPFCAPVQPAPVEIDPAVAAKRARIAAMILRDFGPGANY